MSIEDRVRAATEATAATVREIRPLTLPDDPVPARRPRPLRPLRPRRAPGTDGAQPGWHGWLVPLAAAAVVIVIAAVLAAVRSDLPGPGHAASTPTPAGPGSTAGLPRYGAVLVRTPVKIKDAQLDVQSLSIIDTRAGREIARVSHPAGVTFTGVSGAADDRTFVVSAAYYAAPAQPAVPGDAKDARIWYRLSIGPGTAKPFTLTRLSIPPQPSSAYITGMAQSPDGKTLALLEWDNRPEATDPGSVAALHLYSVATGATLRTWTGGQAPDAIPLYDPFDVPRQNEAGLTWLADGHTLAFTYWAKGQPTAIRTLDTTRPGTDLVAGSRRVFTLPGSESGTCAVAQLMPDGRTAVCGTAPPEQGGNCGRTTPLAVSLYSAATGQRERVLYQANVPCTHYGGGSLGWAGSAGAVVVTVPADGLSDEVTVGLLQGGGIVPLLAGTFPFDQGPGTIAF